MPDFIQIRDQLKTSELNELLAYFPFRLLELTFSAFFSNERFFDVWKNLKNIAKLFSLVIGANEFIKIEIYRS